MTSNIKHDIEATLMPASLTLSQNSFKVDVALRLTLLASTLTAIALLITSNQTVRGPFIVPFVAKFSYAPAFVYLLVVLSVTGFYSIITTMASISIILKPKYSTKLLIFFLLWDVLILGLVDSAVGSAGGVAYSGWLENGYLQGREFCSVFDKFCGHIGVSLAVSFFASLLLVSLAWHDIESLHKRITN